MSKLGRDLIKGMKEAAAHAKGDATGARTRTVELPDARPAKSPEKARTPGLVPGAH